MLDPVTGNVIPNGMQDVRALGMTTQANPFLSGVPAGAQSLGAPMATQIAQAPGPAVPATMPGLPGDAGMAAATGMPTGGPMARPNFSQFIPQGLLQALIRMQAQRPEMFAQMLQRPMAQRFGITPETNLAGMQTRQDARQDWRAQQGRGGFGGNDFAPIGMAQPAQGGGGMGFAPPNRDAQFAAQSQIGMDSGKAKNQNIGSVPAY